VFLWPLFLFFLFFFAYSYRISMLWHIEHAVWYSTDKSKQQQHPRTSGNSEKYSKRKEEGMEKSNIIRIGLFRDGRYSPVHYGPPPPPPPSERLSLFFFFFTFFLIDPLSFLLFSSPLFRVPYYPNHLWFFPIFLVLLPKAGRRGRKVAQDVYWWGI